MASIYLSRYEAEEGDLPDVCMCCGEPATERKRRRFIWCPGWVYALIPLGFLPYVLVSTLLTEKISCYILFCPRHKNHWRKRGLIPWLAFPVVLALIAGGWVGVAVLLDRFDEATRGYLIGAAWIWTLLLLVGWFAMIPLMQLTAIHPSPAGRGLILKRISPEFVQAVEDYRASRDRDEEDEDDRPEVEPVEDDEHIRRPPGLKDPDF